WWVCCSVGGSSASGPRSRSAVACCWCSRPSPCCLSRERVARREQGRVYNEAMCLLVFAWQSHPDHALIFAGNRDERHAPASAPAGLGPDGPQVLGGRDLEAGGTWLGVTLGGRFAVVTNYRDGLDPPKAPRSRGALTTEFLTGDMGAAEYLDSLRPRAAEY